MSASTTFGRVLDTTVSGTGPGSYVVPTDRIAFIQIAFVNGSTPISSAFQHFLTLTIDSQTRGTQTEQGGYLSLSGLATAGQTITWAGSALTAASPYYFNYRILLLYPATS